MEITIITNPSPTSANVNATTAAAAPLPHPRTQRESLTAEFLSSITFNSACANANDELLQVLDQQQPPPSLHPIPFYKRRKHSTLFSGGGVAAAAAAAGGGSGSEKAISSLLQRDASSQYTGAGGGGIASRLSDLEGTPVPKLGLGKRKSNSCIPPSKNEDPHHLTARSLYCSSSDHHHAVSLHSLLDQSMTALNGRFILLPSIRYTASISATSSDQGGVTKLLFASNSGTPLSYFSVITNTDSSRQNYKRTKAKSNRTFAMIQFEKLGVNITNISENIKRRKAQSYARCLAPSEFLSPQPIDGIYNPYFVDDPELKTGKNRVVFTLAGFIGSVIQYSRPLDLKKELNEVFRDTHPNVDQTLTLSQIRNLKSRILEICKIQDMELSSAAIAFVYFEKLVLKGLVNKATRRLIGGVCLLLAAKVNDPKEKKYTQMLETMEKVLEIPAKEIYEHEFSVYAALEFSLLLPKWEVMPHLERILSAEGKSIEEYTSFKTFYLGESTS